MFLDLTRKDQSIKNYSFLYSLVSKFLRLKYKEYAKENISILVSTWQSCGSVKESTPSPLHVASFKEWILQTRIPVLMYFNVYSFLILERNNIKVWKGGHLTSPICPPSTLLKEQRFWFQQTGNSGFKEVFKEVLCTWRQPSPGVALYMLSHNLTSPVCMPFKSDTEQI